MFHYYGHTSQEEFRVQDYYAEFMNELMGSLIRWVDRMPEEDGRYVFRGGDGRGGRGARGGGGVCLGGGGGGGSILNEK